MDEDARRIDAAAPPGESIPVPTAGQVVTRSLPTVAVMVAGLPLLTWWVLEEDPGEFVSFILLCGYFLVATSVQRLVQPPRPRLDKGLDRKPLNRALAIAFDGGSLPDDPARRSAAGALACQYLEGVLLMAAGVIGIGLTALVRPMFPWLVPAAVLVTLMAINFIWARRGWAYLKALHATPPVDTATATSPPKPTP